MKTTLDPRFPSEEYKEYDEKSRHDSSPMKYGITRRQNLESPWDLEKNIRRDSWDGTLKPEAEFEEVTSSDLEGKMCEKCERNKKIAYSWNPTLLPVPWFEWIFHIGFVVTFVFTLVVMTVADANRIKGENPNEDISKTPLAGMTHIGSFDLRHADLNTTMPWLCTTLQDLQNIKDCYDITWVFGSYAGWGFLAFCWMHFSAMSFFIVGVSCLSYAVIFHHKCLNLFHNPVIRRKEEVNLVPKKQVYFIGLEGGMKGSFKRLFSSKWRSEPSTLGICISFVIILWACVIWYNKIHRES